MNLNFLKNGVTWLIIALVVLILAATLESITGVGMVKGPQLLQPPPPVGTTQVQSLPAPVNQTPASPDAPATFETSQMLQEEINHAISMARHAVVAISVPTSSATPTVDQAGLSYIQPYPGNGTPIGSGIIINSRGFMLTSLQTIGKAQEVTVRLLSGKRREYKADVITVDKPTDLAVLKIRSNEVFPAAMIGNSDFVETGDLVFAVGSPYGFSRTVTMGIVSSNRRRLTIDGAFYPQLIQTDAAINDGDSGGPLINVRGEVIGINIAYFVPGKHFSGIGFAVPINEARHFLNASVVKM